jgi:hypothetical protein
MKFTPLRKEESLPGLSSEKSRKQGKPKATRILVPLPPVS